MADYTKTFTGDIDDGVLNVHIRTRPFVFYANQSAAPVVFYTRANGNPVVFHIRNTVFRNNILDGTYVVSAATINTVFRHTISDGSYVVTGTIL